MGPTSFRSSHSSVSKYRFRFGRSRSRLSDAWCARVGTLPATITTASTATATTGATDLPRPRPLRSTWRRHDVFAAAMPATASGTATRVRSMASRSWPRYQSTESPSGESTAASRYSTVTAAVQRSGPHERRRASAATPAQTATHSRTPSAMGQTVRRPRPTSPSACHHGTTRPPAKSWATLLPGIATISRVGARATSGTASTVRPARRARHRRTASYPVAIAASSESATRTFGWSSAMPAAPPRSTATSSALRPSPGSLPEDSARHEATTRPARPGRTANPIRFGVGERCTHSSSGAAGASAPRTAAAAGPQASRGHSDFTSTASPVSQGSVAMVMAAAFTVIGVDETGISAAMSWNAAG